MSVATWRSWEGGESGKELTASKICNALGWTTDSIARILEGQEPIVDLSDDRQSGDVMERLDRLDSRLDEVDGTLGRLVETMRQVVAAIQREQP